MNRNIDNDWSSQSVNIRAVQWALYQPLPGLAKAVLYEYAIHANQRGYSYPSIDRIAFRCRTSRASIRRQIKTLLVRRLLLPTKKCFGDTHQIRAYRLPKVTRQSGSWRSPLEKAKADRKRTESGSKADHGDPRIRNKEEHSPNGEITFTPFAISKSLANPARPLVWRSHYSEEELRIIDAYRVVCAPDGWFKINRDCRELHELLPLYFWMNDLELEQMLRSAIAAKYEGSSVYNRPRGAKLIRILAENLTGL